ncbi:MAG TPA: response regulator [Thermoanaerobaculia bacterium]|nr:response regulator [Thermoanaerobaculia bacterium]
MSKILIVDDDESVLALYSAVLRKEGYEVLTVAGARKALDLAVSAQPNLILLDVTMPSFDGGDAFGYLSGNSSTKEIPVIFLTSLVSEDEVEAGKGKIGGHEYISKSTSMSKFIVTVKEALSRTPRMQS